MQFSNHIDHQHNINNNDSNFNTSENNTFPHQNTSSSTNPYQYKDEEGFQHELNQNEIREVAFTRAAARFGRLFLRDPTTLVEPKLLRQLVTAVRTTAGMGHRSSIVLWGPPQGGKRSTLEALAQIFCVTVEHRAAAAATAAAAASSSSANNNLNNNNFAQQQQQQNKNSNNNLGGNNNNNAASSSSLMINIHRHPQNSSSTVGGGSGGGNSGTNSSGKHSNNQQQQQATNAKGIPILGVVLDGTALRSDHDAAQQCLNALYDFWWLAASVRNREMKKFGEAGAAAAAAALQLRHQQQRMRQENQAKATAAAAAAAAKKKNSGTTTTERQSPPPAAQRADVVKTKKQILSETKMSKKKALLANLLKKNKSDSDDDDSSSEEEEEEESSTSEDDAPKKKANVTKKGNDKNNKTPTGKKTRRGRPAGSSIKKRGRKLTATAAENDEKIKNPQQESSPKKPVVGKKVAKKENEQNNNQQQQVYTSTNNNSNTSNANKVNNNPILGGVPFWCIQADELLNWLFTEALPESMHKQAPPTSTAAATSNTYNNFMNMSNSQNANNTSENNVNSSNNRNSGTTTSTTTTTHHNNNNSNFHSGNDMNYLIAAHHHNAFRTAIQQTFRVFTHGGNTVLTALQTSLLELSKCGVSPCFLIHDIRMLGQTCDKILYMISGLLHEQEILANITTTPSRGEGSNKNNNSNNKNNSSSDGASSFSMTSMMNANIPGLLISAQNNHDQNQQSSSSFFVGGGLSIVMTSPNPDLRLEKRLSSRMNCDYYFCPQIIPNFVTCLAWSFRPLHENVDQNEALHFTQQWAIEDASVRPVKNPLPATNSNNNINNGKTSSEKNNNNSENHLPIASLVVPTNTNNNNNNANNFEKPSSGTNNNNPNQNQQQQQQQQQTLQQQQLLLARRRLRASEDPRQLFMNAVMELEDDIGEMLLNEITHPTTGGRVMHPLRGMYLDFSLKCEQLSRPAHIVRRLMETWFELAIESCHFVLPPATNNSNSNSAEKSQQAVKVGVDIFSDPKYFITGDMLERACFGYSESLTLQDSSNQNANKTGASSSNLLYSFGRTTSNAPTTNLDTSPASVSATSNFHVYYANSLISNTPMVPCSQATAGPLRPLTAFSLNGPSSSMPRECVSLLTCLISGILQQRRGAMNAQIRTLQDHYTMFQELRGGGAGASATTTTTTTTTSSSGPTSGTNKNQNNLTSSTTALLSSSSSSASASSNTDSIDSWLKAAALLRRWGIIRAWSSSGVVNSNNSGNNNNNANNNMSSQQSGNIAVSITATSKLDLEIENVEALIKLVQSSISVVFDNATAQNIKALLRERNKKPIIF